jgi:hypothetical protein
MATFCPYCDEEIENIIYGFWVGDYPTFFDFECPKCKKEFEVDVEATPIFRCYKKEKSKKTG